MASRRSIFINLGIDFGTRFTKACARDLGAEESALVTFGAKAIDRAVVPSIVYIDDHGGLSLDPKPGYGSIRYLKMRLAGMPISDDLDNGATGIINLENPKVIGALSSWYLASILRKTQDWVSEHWAERMKSREPQWSANVGVPVEHAESPIIDNFNLVNLVAWNWFANNELPVDLESALSSYEKIENSNKKINKIQAIPELTAAVRSFVSSREASENIYIYVDVGGGTLDAVCFHYFRRDGMPEINVFSGKVEPYGATVLARKLGGDEVREFEEKLIENRLDSSQIEVLKAYKTPIFNLIGTVISKGNKIDRRDWREVNIQVRPAQDWLLRLRERVDEHVNSIVVFVGGGGANSKWYQNTIVETYTIRKLDNLNIPPFDLMRVPLPADLDISQLNEKDFQRFSIAYGLSVPKEEGPEVRLPKVFKPYLSQGKKEKDESKMPEIGYSDSKDAYD